MADKSARQAANRREDRAHDESGRSGRSGLSGRGGLKWRDDGAEPRTQICVNLCSSAVPFWRLLLAIPSGILGWF